MRLYRYARSEAPFRTGDILQLQISLNASIYVEGLDQPVEMKKDATFVVYRTYAAKNKEHGYNMLATYPEKMPISGFRVYAKDARNYRILGQHFGKKVKNKPSDDG